jgi:methionyl-tRNA formyltransferase
MKITILCNDEKHPVNGHLIDWIKCNQELHDIQLVRSKSELISGDLLFLISCNEIVRTEDRNKFSKTLVIHASDLPHGRGWSPHVWRIVEGAESITVTLLEAEDKVDSGAIWKQVEVVVSKDCLWNEINKQLFEAECVLMSFAVENFSSIEPKQQDSSVEPSYYPKRTPQDSEIDPHKSIAEQFDLIRVCDPKRFPAYFQFHGHTYEIQLKKK